MSTRCLLASSLIACTVVGFTSPQVRAADKPAATTQPPVWTGLVPDDAFAAIVFYPRRVLTSEGKSKLELSNLIGEMAAHGGYSPTEVEQLVILRGPPAVPGRLNDPNEAVIARLSTPHDGAQTAKKMLGRDPETEEIAGHKCFFLPRAPSGAPGICFLDEKTFVFCNRSWLPQVFGAKGAQSPLIMALDRSDSAADATIIFVNTDAGKEFLAETVRLNAFSGPLKSVGDLPNLLQAAELTIHTNPQISLKLTLLGKDDDSAGKMAQMIKSFQQLGEAFLPALQVPPGGNIPPDQRESRTIAAGLATKLIEGLVPHLSGKQVTVEIGSLGTLDAVVGKLVLPGLIAARKAARRTQGANSLKQLALAMHGCYAKDGHFPANAIYSKEGKPQLSWRVYVLPQLDQTKLFLQFHLDEPWDSDNNKPLIAKMPAIFKSASGKPLAEGRTRFVVPFGKATVFDGDTGIGFDKITDGLSNTILILEVGEDKSVIWTKPDDMDFDPQKPLAGLGTIGDDGIPAAFADGSVRSIRKNVDAETFRRLILRNDGLPVDPKKF